MRIIRKGILPVTGFAAVILAITIANPGAVKAVTATLVQIVNTPTNSVATVHAPPASQIDSHACGSSSSKATLDCGDFYAPDGKTFVIQTVTVAVTPEPGYVPVFASLDSPFGWPIAYVPLVQQGSNSGRNTYVGTISGASLYVKSGHSGRCGVTLSGSATSGYHWFYCQVQGYYVPAQ